MAAARAALAGADLEAHVVDGDQPAEALVRGNEVIVSNMDWPFPGMRNSKHTMPAVITVIKNK